MDNDHAVFVGSYFLAYAWTLVSSDFCFWSENVQKTCMSSTHQAVVDGDVVEEIEEEIKELVAAAERRCSL